MLKRVLPTLLAILMLTSALAGCGQPAATGNTEMTTQPSEQATEGTTTAQTAAEAPITLKFMQNSANGGQEESLKRMIDDFQTKYPNIKIEAEIVPWADYYTKLNIVINSGVEDIDVFEVGYENFAQYAKNGQLLNLDEVIAADADFKADTMKQMVMDAYQYNGNQLGVATDFTGCIMYYNKDLFDAKGVAYPQVEWTWKEELDAAQKLTDAGTGTWGTISPVQIYELYKTVAQNGGSFWDEKTSTINSKETVEALQWMLDKSLKYKVTPNFTSDIMTQPDADTNAFIEGKVAMLRGGVWQIGRFTQECAFRWDVIVEPGNVAKAHNFFSNGLVVNKNSKNAAAAWQFIKYMAIDKDAIATRIENGWNIPIVNDDVVMEAYYKITPPESRKYVAAISDAISLPPLGPIPELWGDIQTIVNEQIDKAKYGKLDVQAAMDEAKIKLEKLIK